MFDINVPHRKFITGFPEISEVFFRFMLENPLDRPKRRIYHLRQLRRACEKIGKGAITETLVDEGWREMAMAGTVAAGLMGNPASATDTNQQLAMASGTVEQSPEINRELIRSQVVDFVKKNVDWRKVPWYAPEPAEILRQVAIEYLTALKNHADPVKMVADVKEYLVPGALEKLESLWTQHTKLRI
jgi:hypothetical protein